MANHSSVTGYFKTIRERVEKRAQENLIQALPMLADIMHDYAEQELKKRKKSSMTGNFINSFGIALYKDGKFIAVGTSHDIEGQSPTQVTLANGDTFAKWRMRYDGRMQFHPFTAATGTHRFYANEEVLKWLRSNPLTRKGFGFRVVSVVDYTDLVGGTEVLLRIADDIEDYGGHILRYNLG